MKRSKKAVGWGIIIIITGLLYLANNLDLLGFNIFFPGWWTVFIIVPSVIGLFYRDEMMQSVLGIIIGVLLLMAAQDFIAWSRVWQLFFPFLIISVGVSILFKPSFKKTVKKNRHGSAEYIGVFGGVDEKISDKFTGASCVAVFGGVSINLEDAIITDDVVIDCVSVFGGVEIKLPKDVIVKTAGVSIFGGADNQYKEKSAKKGPLVYINHVSIFGGTELR